MKPLEDNNKEMKVKMTHAPNNQLKEERNRKGKKKVNFEQEEEEEEDDGNLLSSLPSQKEKPSSSSAVTDDHKEARMDEILSELKSVKRQNSITHCLISVLIVVTVAWQCSEVMLLHKLKNKVKDKVSNPMQTVGDIISSSFKGEGEEKKKPAIEAPTGIPQLPQRDLPSWPSSFNWTLFNGGRDK